MKNLNHNLWFNKLRVRGLKPLELGVSIGAIKNKMLLNMMEVELVKKQEMNSQWLFIIH